MPTFDTCAETSSYCLPKRSTSCAAGYDFYAAEDIEIPSFWAYLWKMICRKEFKPTIVYTNIKAKMAKNEALLIFNRSSNPSRGLLLANGVGVVDSDYYGNEDNDGNIGFPFYNIFPWKVKISRGQKIGQGVFVTFKKTADDTAEGTRTGGFGSTGK